MNAILVFEQLLNGAGYGLMLFLIAAGLTLVFGVMDVLNLSHGSLFMVGAYVAAQVHVQSGSFALAVGVAVVVTAAVAALLEVTLMRRLYGRDHLAQVLATFGVILVADDAVKMIWGPSPVMASAPAALAGPVELFAGLPYPSYRLLVLGAGVLVALLLYLLVNHSRVGMLVRAGASNRWMAELMGVRVTRIFSGIFVLGAALAALAGALMGPLVAVQVGMGESILIRRWWSSSSVALARCAGLLWRRCWWGWWTRLAAPFCPCCCAPRCPRPWRPTWGRCLPRCPCTP